MLNRCVENMDVLQAMGKDKKGFFFDYMEIPMKADYNGLDLYVLQCRNHILKPLAENYGIDTSDAAIRKAVADHNKVCELLRAIGDFRKLDEPVITGYEYNVLCLASYVAPKHLIIDKLEDTLKELKKRKPDEKQWFTDRFCYGSLPGRDPIELNDEEDALTQVCRHYMYRCECPRMMDTPTMDGRREYVAELAKEYKADGIIYQQMKFCDPWAYERMLGSHILREEYGYPVLAVDRPYAIGTSGQMRTRVQAFIESIDIKKIQKGGK